jgi:hypothetical protein
MESSASRTRFALAPLALAGALLVGGCAGTDTTDLTGPSTTDTFTGTLAASGSATFGVTVKTNGELDLSLTTLAPQTTITVGLGIGTPQAGQCALITAAENSKVGTILPAEVAPGNYCVIIYDVGNVQGLDSFTLSVLHP